MEVATLRRTFHGCPGGTPPVYFGGRYHCFQMKPPGLGLGNLGEGNPGGLLLFAALIAGAYYVYKHKDNIFDDVKPRKRKDDDDEDEDTGLMRLHRLRHR